MKLLSLDTATSVAAVGVVSNVAGDGPWEVEIPAKNHAPTLMGAIDDVLKRAGLTLGELDGIAVGIGPGSFTGVRIGVATARALAFASSKPIWGITTLEAMARRAQDAGAPPNAIVVASVPSRQGELFAAAFDNHAPIFPPRIIAVPELDAWIESRNVCSIRIGVGSDCPGPRARDIAALAFSRMDAAPLGDGDALTPVYLAPPPVKST